MTMTGDSTVAGLADEIRSGSRSAMAALFDAHADAVYTYCFRRCAAWDVAEDLTSTVFLEAWRGRDRMVVHNGSLLPWLYGIATNVCRNQARSQRRHLRAVARLPRPLAVADHADEAVSKVDDGHRMRAIHGRIAALSKGDRDVLALVVWEQLDYPSVAAALSIPVGTVKSRMARVRRRLAAPESDRSSS
jgi:RNA polymerase sigma-70 factor (ECF subfamily)